MAAAFAWVLVVTGWIQPAVDSSLADRFLSEKFGHLVEDPSGGTAAVVLAMLRQPLALLQALVSPPGATLGFVLALTLPLLFVPLRSVDAALLVAVPLFIALVSQGRTALAVTLRYVLALVPGLYLGAVLWWQAHPQVWERRRLRPLWTAAITLGLVLTLLGNPHRSLSALIPDSFAPWVHVLPQEMLARRHAARLAVAQVPPTASVSADTPLLPLLAQREQLIRFPKHLVFRDRAGEEREVDYVVAFPGYYTSMAPVFKRERKQQASIRDRIRRLTDRGEYALIHCQGGAVVLRRGAGTAPGQTASAGSANRCAALD